MGKGSRKGGVRCGVGLKEEGGWDFVEVSCGWKILGLMLAMGFEGGRGLRKEGGSVILKSNNWLGCAGFKCKRWMTWGDCNLLAFLLKEVVVYSYMKNFGLFVGYWLSGLLFLMNLFA